MMAYPLMLAVMDDKETAASSVDPKRPTENTEATVREYCNKKVMINGIEYFNKTRVSVFKFVSGSPNMELECTDNTSLMLETLDLTALRSLGSKLVLEIFLLKAKCVGILFVPTEMMDARLCWT